MLLVQKHMQKHMENDKYRFRVIYMYVRVFWITFQGAEVSNITDRVRLTEKGQDKNRLCI